MSTAIKDIPELQPYVAALGALGYRNTDQLVGAGRGAAPQLATYLQMHQADLALLLNNLPQHPTPVGLGIAHHRLGGRIDMVPLRINVAMSMPTNVDRPLPQATNLIDTLRPVRHQMNRGTCVAQAATAIAEQYWLRKNGTPVDLSRQFLYWNCKRHDGIPQEEGTWISVAMPLLKDEGCPLEGIWPYNPNDVAGNEGQDPPPAGAIKSALEFAVHGFQQLSPTAVHDIKAVLASGRAVAFSIPVFNSWYLNSEVQRTGDIVNPIPTEVAIGGHAMCFVGYDDRPADFALGGGVFIVRNSWGQTWGTESIAGVGYGSIPYSYISRFGMEAFSIDEL